MHWTQQVSASKETWLTCGNYGKDPSSLAGVHERRSLYNPLFPALHKVWSQHCQLREVETSGVTEQLASGQESCFEESFPFALLTTHCFGRLVKLHPAPKQAVHCQFRNCSALT